MRKLLAVPAALMMLLATSAIASATAPANSVTVSYSPSTTIGAKPLSTLTLSSTTTYGPAGSTQVPDLAYQTSIGLPITVNGKKFFSCSKDEVTEYLTSTSQGQKPRKACNKAAVGTGSATAYGVPCGKHPTTSTAGVQQLTLSIQLFNGPGELESYLQVTSPSSLSSIKGLFQVKLSKTANGTLFSFALPQSLLEAVKGLCSPITAFSLTINKSPAQAKASKKKSKGKKVKFITTAACKKSPWVTTFHNDFTDGSTNADGSLTNAKVDTADASAATACKRK